MASVRAVLCYVALFTFTVFYVKQQAFCSSNQLYDVEQNHGPKETFIYSSSFRRISGTGPRTSRTSLWQILLLLSGDVETYPGPVARCGLCLKTVRKKPKQNVLHTTSFNVSFEMLWFG